MAGPSGLVIRRLGLVDYQPTLDAMRRLTEERGADTPDEIWLLQHPRVFTQGQAGKAEHVLAPGDIPVIKVERGGQGTYHGPGQLIAYPILDLKPDRKDLHRYLRDLEAVLIAVAASFDVQAERNDGLTGVWTKMGKLAAIGVRVSSGWITSHGVALNVSTDLEYFGTIVPCGIPDRAVTSLERELGRAVGIPEASQSLVERFADVFLRDIIVV